MKQTLALRSFLAGSIFLSASPMLFAGQTWTAGGGATTTSNTASNWGGTLPSGSSTLTFAGAGNTVTWNGIDAGNNVNNQGFIFSAGGNAFTFNTSGAIKIQFVKNANFTAISNLSSQLQTINPLTSIFYGTVKTYDGGSAAGASLALNGGIDFRNDGLVPAGTTNTLNLIGSNNSTTASITESVGFDATHFNAVTKGGTGQWTVTGNATYTGATTITQGTLEFDGSVASSSITNNSNLAFNNGADQSYGNIISGSGTLLKNGVGTTLTLSGANTFENRTVIQAGTLSVSSINNYGSAGNLGKDTAATPTQLGFLTNDGTLAYTGAGESNNRTFKIGDGGATNTAAGGINNNGSGALIFTEPTSFNTTIAGITATRTLTLGGTYAGATSNEIQGVIQDNAATGKINLTINGSSWKLSGANTYTGATTITSGRLAIGSTGIINNTSGVSIGAGEFNYNNSTTALSQGISFSGSTGTLSGTGTITPAVTITSGNRQTAGSSVTTANTTASVGKETFTTGITYNQGSIFEWNLNADNAIGIGTRGTDYDAVNAGALATTGTNATFRVILNGSQNFSEAFWNTDRTWSNIFTGLDGTTAYDLASIFNSNVEFYNSAGLVSNANMTGRSFTLTGSSLTWTAVPEPTSALAGLLLTAGLLRRRRA